MRKEEITAAIATYKCHLEFAEEVVTNARLSSGYVIYCYCQIDNVLPPKSVTDLCDEVRIIQQPKSGKRLYQYQGDVMGTKLSLNLASKRSKYVLKLHGDMLVRKPENWAKHFDWLGENEYYSTTWGPNITFCGFFFGESVPIFNMYEPIEIHRESPQLERVLQSYLHTSGIKYKLVDQYKDEYKQWYNDLGIGLLDHKKVNR